MNPDFRKLSIAGGIALATIATSALAQTPPQPNATAQQTPTPESQKSGQQTPQTQGTSQTQGQTQPQGPTGPTETTSGGAPAASPQGETPPGMQHRPTNPPAKGTSESR